MCYHKACFKWNSRLHYKSAYKDFSSRDALVHMVLIFRYSTRSFKLSFLVNYLEPLTQQMQGTIMHVSYLNSLPWNTSVHLKNSAFFICSSPSLVCSVPLAWDYCHARLSYSGYIRTYVINWRLYSMYAINFVSSCKWRVQRQVNETPTT